MIYLNIIFTIEKPCSEKSSFSEIIMENFKNYNKIDDFLVLKEIFEGDEIIFQKEF